MIRQAQMKMLHGSTKDTLTQLRSKYLADNDIKETLRLRREAADNSILIHRIMGQV